VGKITLFFCAGAIYIFSAVFLLSSLLSIACLMPVVVRALFYAPDVAGRTLVTPTSTGMESKRRRC